MSNYYEGQKTFSWPSVTGEIQTREKGSSSTPKSGTSHWVKLTYQYAVNGTPYVSDRIGISKNAFTSNFHGRLSKRSYSYKVGNKINVFYNPVTPSESVIIQGSHFVSSNYWLNFIVQNLIAAFLLFICWHPSVWRFVKKHLFPEHGLTKG
jgi:hypothetical protein